MSPDRGDPAFQVKLLVESDLRRAVLGARLSQTRWFFIQCSAYLTQAFKAGETLF